MHTGLQALSPAPSPQTYMQGLSYPPAVTSRKGAMTCTKTPFYLSMSPYMPPSEHRIPDSLSPNPCCFAVFSFALQRCRARATDLLSPLRPLPGSEATGFGRSPLRPFGPGPGGPRLIRPCPWLRRLSRQRGSSESSKPRTKRPTAQPSFAF